ncbi:hypothetical protein J3458_005660 [Metarhizium acridum]|uniref:uncharacterized protein n=1 Tax=Metarhizium acridum TaxID=92637 RepID=UPI001C6CEF2A|nr:hypothetical protein J3458_005660 [Metarhizium acridum]
MPLKRPPSRPTAIGRLLPVGSWQRRERRPHLRLPLVTPNHVLSTSGRPLGPAWIDPDAATTTTGVDYHSRLWGPRNETSKPRINILGKTVPQSSMVLCFFSDGNVELIRDTLTSDFAIYPDSQEFTTPNVTPVMPPVPPQTKRRSVCVYS